MTRTQKFGWAIGSHGTQVMLGVYVFYLLFFLTDVMGISALVAGQLIFIVRIYDLLTDPVMGHISDRTVAPTGRRRPWLLLGALVCPAVFVLVFNLPQFDSELTTILTVGAVLVVYATAYTIFNVPHLAMPAEMTDDFHERTVLFSYRIIFFATANLVAVLGGSLLLKKFGEGRGYSMLGLVVGGTMLVSMLACWYMTRDVRFSERTEAVSVPIREQLRLIADNRPFLVYISAKLAILTAQASQTAALLYFSQYVLQRGAELLTSIGIFLTIGPLLSAPAWTWAARRYGKRNTFIAAALIYSVVIASWLLAGPDEPEMVTNFRVLCIGLTVGGIIILGYSLLPDTIAWDRQRTGINREGMYSGIYSTMEKAASAFGPLLFGIFLAAAGFESSSADEVVVQSDSAIRAIYIAVGVIPPVAALVAAAILTRYDLDERKLELANA